MNQLHLKQRSACLWVLLIFVLAQDGLSADVNEGVALVDLRYAVTRNPDYVKATAAIKKAKQESALDLATTEQSIDKLIQEINQNEAQDKTALFHRLGVLAHEKAQQERQIKDYDEQLAVVWQVAIDSVRKNARDYARNKGFSVVIDADLSEGAFVVGNLKQKQVQLIDITPYAMPFRPELHKFIDSAGNDETR